MMMIPTWTNTRICRKQTLCKEIERNDLHGRSLLQDIQSSLMTDRKASMCHSPDQEKCSLFLCGYSFRG
ncbi:hypothetical protein YC2023_022418 [Brassica napus]